MYSSVLALEAVVAYAVVVNRFCVACRARQPEADMPSGCAGSYSGVFSDWAASSRVMQARSSFLEYSCCHSAVLDSRRPPWRPVWKTSGLKVSCVCVVCLNTSDKCIAVVDLSTERRICRQANRHFCSQQSEFTGNTTDSDDLFV